MQCPYLEDLGYFELVSTCQEASTLSNNEVEVVEPLADSELHAVSLMMGN